MGNAKSSNVANITSDIVSQEISNEMSKTKLSTDQSQMISVVGGQGNVDISGNTQRMQMTVNMDAVAKQLSTQKSQQSIVQKLSQAAAASTSGLNLFNNAKTDNTMNEVLNASMTVASNLDQICAASNNQNQTIAVDQRDGYVDIHGNVQSEMANVVSKCIQNATATNSSLQQATTDLSETASSSVVGLSLWEIIVLALVGLLAFVLPPLIAVDTAATEGIKVFTSLMGPLMVAGGVVSIWWWTKHKGSTENTMTATEFSTLISNDPACAAVPYVPVQSPSFAPGDNPLNTAGAVCLGDPKCKAFDWNTSVNPPVVTYYSSVDQVPCPNVGTQDLQKAGIDLVSDATFNQGATDPTMTVPASTNRGDVYLNNATGTLWWKVNPDQTKNQWVNVTTGQTFPGWTKTAAVVTGTQATPQNSMGKDGDLYINVSDPTDWEVWKRYSGSYGPLNSADAGNLKVGTNGGTTLTVSYATTNELVFPGRHGNTKPAQNYNWSAYVVVQNQTTYFWLVVGILLCFGGVAIILLKLFNSPASKPAASAAKPAAAAAPAPAPAKPAAATPAKTS